MVGKLCYCGGVIHDGKCDRCSRGKCVKTDNRTTAQRGYDNAWRLLSERFRIDNPLCYDCLANGKVKPSTEVHHKIKIATAPERRLDPTNLMALCSACHVERTKRGE
jgi:5-methylcytosine-specific restriction endonuclease McrA